MIINKTDDYIFIQADESKIIQLPDGAMCKSCYCPLWINLDDIIEIVEVIETEVDNDN